MKRTPLKRGKPPKRKTRLNPGKRPRQVSAKKRAVIAYRKELRAKLINERGNVCECQCSPECAGETHGLHELLKQSAKPFIVGDTRPVLLACNFCNVWIEDNPAKALALKLTVTKYGGAK